MAIGRHVQRLVRSAGAGAAVSLAVVLVAGQVQASEASPGANEPISNVPVARPANGAVAGIAPATPPARLDFETGIASWYGAELAGAATASGEPFDPEALTAAHPELPFGTAVTIVNLDNGRSVEVVVNDRGPFTEDRVIDVSRAAARALDFKDGGTAEVRLEIDPEVLGAAASS